MSIGSQDIERKRNSDINQARWSRIVFLPGVRSSSLEFGVRPS